MPFYSLIRRALFRMDPESAHLLTLGLLDRAQRLGLLDLLARAPVDDPVDLMGLRLRNRVGLAAGLDKNGAHIDGLARLGFGFLEVGTVTPRAQPGNPKPRMFRLPTRRALINRLGFNNDGLDAFVANVERARHKGVLGLNIGKNAATPIEHALDDYLLGLDAVYPYASYVAVNISSPNTRDLRQLQGGDELERMLSRLRERRQVLADAHRRWVPILLKIAPDLDERQIVVIAEAVVRHGIDGLIATNTTVAREAVAGLTHAGEIGGLSGEPVFEPSNAVIRALRRQLPAEFPIVGVGGILSARHACAKIDAGASLVQIYTGLVYRGPSLVRECALALRDQRPAADASLRSMSSSTLSRMP
jgi:dihydroorotate dehydrogenase